MDWNKWKPAVRRHWLFLLSGLTWSGVGVMLCIFAYHWLEVIPKRAALPPGVAGLLLAGAIYHFGFSGVAFKNIRRISRMRARVCLFAFQAPRSYLTVVFMMALGIALRHSAIPKPYLSTLYLGIGGGLLLSSLHYYRLLLQPVSSD